MTHLHKVLFPLALASIVLARPAALQRAAPPAAALALSPFTIEMLPTPAAANSSGPQLIAEDKRAVLSWIERTGSRGSLKFAERTATGWSEARTVVASDHLIVNFADVPSVRYVFDGTLVAHWTEDNGPDPEASTLRVSWSKDAGKTWSAPVSPYADKSETQHGFASIFGVPGGGFGVVWLDGRAETEEMALRSKVYAANGTAGAEAVVDARVCECCSTSTASATDGLLVAFRGRSRDEVRDIYVSKLAAGKWTAPALVHKDGWKLEACPVNGPSIAAAGNDVAVVWFTAPAEPGHALTAFSRDGGRTFGAPVRVDDAASLGRVQIAMLPDGSAAASYVEFANKTSQFRVRRIDRNGGRSPAVTVAGAMGSQHPRIAQAGGELLLAWTETVQGASRVRTARAVAK